MRDELRVGRATRVVSGGRERWTLPASDAAVAARLVELGRAGIGGFEPGDGDGLDLVRVLGDDLETHLASHAVDMPTAIAWIASLADALAACETRALFPGALDASRARVRGDRLALSADSLVHAMLGAPAPDEPAPKWGPPEGGVPDNAANRYALGVIAYRLVTGEHPFAGRGLRAGLDDQAERGAPPFPASVTAPPGLQSAVLRMLDPDPARRFPAAAAIATAVRGCVPENPPTRHGTETIDSEASAPKPLPETASPRPTPTSGSPANASGRRGGSRRVLALAPIAVGVASAIVIATSFGSSVTPKVAAATPAPLKAASKADDCATCHPRQAAEWSRSVMAHSLDSPLFGSLESLIEEQVARDRFCPGGAGILRAPSDDTCVDRRTGIAITGAGGPGWCVNCHAPGENIERSVPAWRAHDTGRTRLPARDLLRDPASEGISCAACHQITGPAHPGDAYEGNPSWISPDTGARFSQRPEDARGLFGIANSGYSLDPRAFAEPDGKLPHHRTSQATKDYRASSEFCGACHDVRLFGTDSLRPDEHFKRLRNAYSEWVAYADGERRAGRTPATCQDCHMSLFPGVCEPAPGHAAGQGCPAGTQFSPRAPGTRASGHRSATSAETSMASHYFSSVDVPLTASFDPAALDDPTLDASGVPLGARARRDQLLASAFSLAIDSPRASGGKLEIPIVVENVGAGHRVPAGFSQEREIWVHLRVTDANGRLVYEVGRVDRGDEDLRDKTFVHVNTDDTQVDRAGRPLGLFGADVADGPDVPRWTGDAREQHGRGLVNFQNGFLRCVRCIGTIDEAGRCQAGPGQETFRAQRFVDGDYDADTGECRSNLTGANALFETYFPVGALDATRGLLKGPDAIVDTRSLPPHAPARYVYELDALSPGPYTVEATLEFRAFPPYLVRAFADYEATQVREGKRADGPQVDTTMLERLEVVHVATARAVIR